MAVENGGRARRFSETIARRCHCVSSPPLGRARCSTDCNVAGLSAFGLSAVRLVRECSHPSHRSAPTVLSSDRTTLTLRLSTAPSVGWCSHLVHSRCHHAVAATSHSSTNITWNDLSLPRCQPTPPRLSPSTPHSMQHTTPLPPTAATTPPAFHLHSPPLTPLSVGCS